jgi:hypothetical protein
MADLDKFKQLFNKKTLGILAAVNILVLILYFVAGVGSSNLPTEAQSVKYCKTECNNLQEQAQGPVKQAEIYSYCKDTFKVKAGTPLTGPKMKENQTQYCSNNARCPNLNTCQLDEKTLNIQGCIEFMNQYHREELGENQEQAQQHTKDILTNSNQPDSKSCSEDPDWLSKVEN